MDSLNGRVVVDYFKRKVEDDDADYLLRKLEIAAYSGGLVDLREPVSNDPVADRVGWGLFVTPTVGMEVMAMHLGGGEYVVVCPVFRAVPTLLGPPAPLLGQTYHDARDSTNADTASTANTATYVQALSLVTTLPNGTYDVMAAGSQLMAHDSGIAGNLRITCGGTSDAGITSPALPAFAAMTMRVATACTFSPVVVSGGSLTTLLEYKGVSGAGPLTYARNCALEIHAVRTA